MNRVWRLLAATIVLWSSPHLLAREVVCHIHAPDDFTPFSKQPLVIPAVGDRIACERMNLERFGSRGRCHCVQDRIGMEREVPLDFIQSEEQQGQLP
ncbi:MAG: hypothetical protein ABW098_17925 [Candidatus Thiodiazotropha sp.]